MTFWQNINYNIKREAVEIFEYESHDQINEIYDVDVVTNGYIERINEHFAHSAHLEVTNANEGSLLERACVTDNLNVLQLLVNNGAYVHDGSAGKHSLLHTCACFNSPLTCTYLLDTQLIDVNAKNIFNQTPLHFACKYSSLDVLIQLCYRTDIDLNAIDADGNTPFLLACHRRCNIEIGKFLIARGCDINRRDNNNRSPLDVACEYDKFEIVKELLAQPHLIRDYSNQITAQKTINYLEIYGLNFK